MDKQPDRKRLRMRDLDYQAMLQVAIAEAHCVTFGLSLVTALASRFSYTRDNAGDEYTFSHLALDPSLQGNVRLMYCDAGHMLYTYKPCLDSLRHSIEEFYGQALSSSQAERILGHQC